jgi:hypothetical protein
VSLRARLRPDTPGSRCALRQTPRKLHNFLETNFLPSCSLDLFQGAKGPRGKGTRQHFHPLCRLNFLALFPLLLCPSAPEFSERSGLSSSLMLAGFQTGSTLPSSSIWRSMLSTSCAC